jgi:hypothetical protein
VGDVYLVWLYQYLPRSFFLCVPWVEIILEAFFKRLYDSGLPTGHVLQCLSLSVSAEGWWLFGARKIQYKFLQEISNTNSNNFMKIC